MAWATGRSAAQGTCRHLATSRRRGAGMGGCWSLGFAAWRPTPLARDRSLSGFPIESGHAMGEPTNGLFLPDELKPRLRLRNRWQNRMRSRRCGGSSSGGGGLRRGRAARPRRIDWRLRRTRCGRRGGFGGRAEATDQRQMERPPTDETPTTRSAHAFRLPSGAGCRQVAEGGRRGLTKRRMDAAADLEAAVGSAARALARREAVLRHQAARTCGRMVSRPGRWS